MEIAKQKIEEFFFAGDVAYMRTLINRYKKELKEDGYYTMNECQDIVE